MIRGSMGPWIADIAANFLAITLIVLIIAAQSQSSLDGLEKTVSVQSYAVVPEGGADAVELLRSKLRDPSPINAVDLLSTGVARAGDGSENIVLFVLDQSSYPDVVTGLTNRSQSWRELSVPDALTDGAGGWAAEFLALRSVAEQPQEFREAFLNLLTRDGGGSGTALAPDESGAPQTLTSRLRAIFGFGRDVASLVALLCLASGLLWIRQRAARG